MTAMLPERADVPLEHTWDLASLYADPAAWEADAARLTAELPALAALQGRLNTAPNLLAWITAYATSAVRAWNLFSYAGMNFDVDTTDQARAGLRDRAIGLSTRFAAATAFAEPEILYLEPTQLGAFLAAEPARAVYRQYLRRRLSHLQEHPRRDLRRQRARQRRSRQRPWVCQRARRDPRRAEHPARRLPQPSSLVPRFRRSSLQERE
jgi:oligoendopeptidase F